MTQPASPRFFGSFAPARTIAHESLNQWSDRKALLRLLVFGGLVLLFLFQSVQYWQAVIDDSYITFRFVDMFVKGHGWRFNPDGPRVEGFTNFLWAVLLIPPHLLGWDLMLVSKVMGVACGILAMFSAWRLARWVRDRDDFLNLLAPALMAANAHFAHWGMMGLETLMQVAFVTAAYWLFVKEMRDSRQLPLSAVMALLAALTRFDSLYYLSPLGLYGLWALARRHATFGRACLWALIAGLPFLVYTGWKAAYFGSLLPNTYWAKQRHVLFDGRDRGHEQLAHYYFAQSDKQRVSPPAWGSEPSGTAGPKLRNSRMARALHLFFAGPWYSWAWMNLWLVGLAGSVLWVLLGGRGGYRAATALVLAPWAMNVFFIHHVNGDWMPGFRFFQVALPFIGVAFVVGLAWLSELILRGRLRFLAPLLGLWLVAAIAWEQLQINTIYIFGADSFIYIPREAGWWTPNGIADLWGRGFAPPLKEISEKLLTSTEDGTSIFMSDIGQPMWFSEHLSVYDVDGLVDPQLAHAPSARGDLPTVEELESQLLGGRTDVTREERRSANLQARKDDFAAQVDRNAHWLMEQEKPDYLLIFINHVDPNPSSPGGAYPWISAQVQKHPGMQDYVEMWNAPKVGNAYNHLYRRRDVETTIPKEKRIARILRAIERNPRMVSLGILLIREATNYPELTKQDRAKFEAIMKNLIRRFPYDPALQELTDWRVTQDWPELNAAFLRAVLDGDPGNTMTWTLLAQAKTRAGDRPGAIAVLREGIASAAPDNNELHYMLGWNLEAEGRLDEAVEVLEDAVNRDDADTRAWSDLASMLSRSGFKTNQPVEKRLAWLRRSRAAFLRYREVHPPAEKLALEQISVIEAEIARLETPNQ